MESVSCWNFSFFSRAAFNSFSINCSLEVSAVSTIASSCSVFASTKALSSFICVLMLARTCAGEKERFEGAYLFSRGFDIFTGTFYVLLELRQIFALVVQQGERSIESFIHFSNCRFVRKGLYRVRSRMNADILNEIQLCAGHGQSFGGIPCTWVAYILGKSSLTLCPRARGTSFRSPPSQHLFLLLRFLRSFVVSRLFLLFRLLPRTGIWIVVWEFLYHSALA